MKQNYFQHVWMSVHRFDRISTSPSLMKNPYFASNFISRFYISSLSLVFKNFNMIWNFNMELFALTHPFWFMICRAMSFISSVKFSGIASSNIFLLSLFSTSEMLIRHTSMLELFICFIIFKCF